LNVTHAEDKALFDTRYGAAQARLQAALDGFPPAALRTWCADLGIETFIGSSGRVFPKAMKASPLLRAWLRRLAGQGVALAVRHRWTGFAGERLVFDTAAGQRIEAFDAIVLALGGASWPEPGSTGAWLPWLAERGVAITPFRPA